MILLDKALWHGLRFILEKIERAAETEQGDPRRLRERLLDAQLRFEAGELGSDELAEIERQMLARLRALEAPERRGPIGASSVEIDTSELLVPAAASKGRRRRGVR